MLRLIVLCLLTGFAANTFAVNFATINHEFQSGQFDQAYKDALSLAQAGNLNARLEVGFMYEFGKGVKQNKQKAAEWYLSAVRPNSFNARPLARGWAYYKGIKVTHSDKKAAEWFRMAAELSQDGY